MTFRDYCDGVSRRDFLKAGTLGFLGLNLPTYLRYADAAAAEGKAVDKSAIFVYLGGGQTHLDTWDLKPGAPAEIRGEFKPIKTNVSGIEISEHLPRTARWMHRCAIVRSVHHKAGCHNTLPGFTGSEQPVDINDPIPKDSFPPGMGAVCEYLKPPHLDLPHYVALPTSLGWGFALKRPGPWGGFLGRRYDPLCSECRPAIDSRPPPGRRPMWLGTPFLAD